MLPGATEAEVFRKLGADGIEAVAVGLQEELHRGTLAGGKAAARNLGQAVALDPLRPAMTKWVREHTATLVKQISETSRAALRATLADGINRGRHPTQLAKDLKRNLGLTERQGSAVSRYWASLEAKGLPYAKIEARAQKYAERLLKQRAKTIARTESIAAVSQGRAQLWQQLQEDGVFPEGTVQEWLTANDDRVSEEICAPMHGQRRPVGEPFTTGEGQDIDAPPAHPNCRCTVVLVQGRKR
jgi:SPP1 gp7 family putative phage head morphogenesis protein